MTPACGLVGSGARCEKGTALSEGSAVADSTTRVLLAGTEGGAGAFAGFGFSASSWVACLAVACALLASAEGDGALSGCCGLRGPPLSSFSGKGELATAAGKVTAGAAVARALRRPME